MEGIDINVKDRHGWSPLHCAARFHPEVVSLLLNVEGIKVNKN
jgi:ankyrin repeat protein